MWVQKIIFLLLKIQNILICNTNYTYRIRPSYTDSTICMNVNTI